MQGNEVPKDRPPREPLKKLSWTDRRGRKGKTEEEGREAGLFIKKKFKNLGEEK